ncbi:hypothetical protein H072_6536 [Dactylellina haptotyla CBS 200.50]|uniref:Uncharacterized protein n=1 Tax=Dactylellina haptotyla (strain CBS 200.50) TaxID=1284197 RepID=S8A9U2_DACHA|nr:hypothetical protein H072_6536 [Dactylellina haptotyla CBS 200.50]
MLKLLELPNEVLMEIVGLLVPDFNDKTEFPNHEEWRESPHIADIRSLSITCKHLSLIAQPYLFKIAVFDYPTPMIRLLRTLTENASIRDMIRTMCFCCPLQFCDTISDPYSPRETFVDDNPELILDTKWETEKMDEYAATVFTTANLDAEEYKGFTDSELEAHGEGSYWMSVPDWSQRVGYENALMQGLALALMALAPRLETLIIWRNDARGSYRHFERTIKDYIENELIKDKLLANISRLEFRDTASVRFTDRDRPDFREKLFEIPPVKELVEKGTQAEGVKFKLWYMENA